MPHIERYSDSEIDIATYQAMVTLLWQAGEITDEDGNSTGETWDRKYNVSQFPKSQHDAMRAKLAAFMEANLVDLTSTGHVAGIQNNVNAVGRIGHDYVLTTAGHGAGFWDRGYGEAGDRLTEACKAERAEWYLMETDGGISCLELED